VSELTPLGDLIQARMDTTGWSLRHVGREAGISKSQIAKYMHGPMVNMPTTSRLRQLAGALALPERVVVDAALATVGLARPRGGGVPDIVEALESQPWLTGEDKAALRAFLASKRQTG
jgi:transcriptional regulator with XRE-family HTH domain